MLLDSTSQQNQGFTVNAYLLFGTMAGVLSTSLLDSLNSWFGAADNPMVYGQTLAAVCLISYLGCIPAFARAGEEYKKMVEARAQD